MRHVKTWLLWINKMSPMSPSISNHTMEERQSMANALGMASPDGPSGFECVDDCRCHNLIPATAVAKMYECLIERGFRPPGDVDLFLTQIRLAMISDLLRNPRVEIPWRELAEVGVIVSTRNAAVAAARAQFPRTWQLLEDHDLRDRRDR